jgi:hypothetical protein
MEACVNMYRSALYQVGRKVAGLGPVFGRGRLISARRLIVGGWYQYHY